MNKFLPIILSFCLSGHFLFAQDFGDLPKIEKEKLLADLDLLYQGLDQFHTGMYWYTSKDSVDNAFDEVKKKITHDLNVLEFHKLIAPLVALSREDHTNIQRPGMVTELVSREINLFPLSVVFLGEELYCVKNASDYQDFPLEGKRIEWINGEDPGSIAGNIGSLFASDGYIKTVKFSDLKGLRFALYYFYYYGQMDRFEVKFKDMEAPVFLKAQNLGSIKAHLNSRYEKPQETTKEKKVLEFEILNDSAAYLGVHTFDNEEIKEFSEERKLKVFLKNSFRTIKLNQIKILIVDVSKNSGGSEGNEGLLYSYFGENYQKYKKVRVKTQRAVLDNGEDQPVTLKALGLFERIFLNKKMNDGSLERRSIGKGLKAFQKEPKDQFQGKTYVLISPVTYSGGSEFSNMMYSHNLATFVGQETGGGYYGNTSGYSRKLILPNTNLIVHIPVLQFVMNVQPTIPFGRGVIPHYEVIPTFQEYIHDENASLQYVLNHLINK